MLGPKQEIVGNSCVFKILGDEYIIRGNDSIEYMQEIVAYIETTIENVSKASPRLNKSQVLLFSALKVADELHKLRQEYKVLEELIEEAK
ncbi:MAG TPA: cell division protein ZapA [Bacillota bacterium]|nr:cell division protein ZapA [Bacillota bacterium]